MNFFMPTRLYTVEHCFEKHGDILQGLGRKCTVITGKHAAKESGALKEVSETLASWNTEYSIFDGISQNPTVASCMEAGTSARAFGAEFLIGIGGGSALDAAKAAANGKILPCRLFLLEPLPEPAARLQKCLF